MKDNTGGIEYRGGTDAPQILGLSLYLTDDIIKWRAVLSLADICPNFLQALLCQADRGGVRDSWKSADSRVRG